MENENCNLEKIPVTKGILRIALAIVIGLSALVIGIYGFLFCKTDMSKLFDYAPTVIQTVFTVVFGYIGVEVVRNRFYFSSYGKRNLRKIMSPLLEKYKNSQGIENFIQDLLAKGEYFPVVYQLQKSDSDFNKLWNDFNYYFKTTSKCAKKYLDALQKCIYAKIYEYKMKQQPQS